MITEGADGEPRYATATPAVRNPISRLRHLPLAFGVLGVLSYGAALAGYLLARFDLHDLILTSSDDAFYYAGIARHMAEGRFSTFDGVTRTNGYHPLWLWLITPIYWLFDDRTALFAIRAFEILLIAGGVALIVLAARLARLPWMLLLTAPAALYQHRGLLMGMEAAAGLAMLGLLFLVLVLYARSPSRGTWALTAVVFCLPWARLEYAAISLTTAAALCVLAWPRRGRLRRLVTPLLGAGAGILAYFVWNRLVFGGWLPVSAATKHRWAQWEWELSGDYDLAENLRATLDTWPFDDEVFAALEVCAYLPLAWWLTRRFRRPADRPAAAFLAGAFGLAAGHLAKFVQTAATMLPTSPIFPWYFAPAYLMTTLLAPLRVYVALLAVRWVVGPAHPRVRRIASVGIVAIGAAFVLTATDAATPFREIGRLSRSSFRDWGIVSYTGAQVLNRVLPEGSVVGAKDAGVIGYFSTFPVVNLDGLVNSYAYFHAISTSTDRRNALLRRYGITHFANVQRIGRMEGMFENTDSILFEGVATTNPFPRAFRIWSSAGLWSASRRWPAETRGPGGWFWRRMESRLDYRWGDVGLIVDDGLAQAFVRNCDVERLPAFSWDSRAGGAVYPWRRPRKNDAGFCVTAFDLPDDAVRVATLPADEYLAQRIGDRQPAIRSNWNVYLDEQSLLYVTNPCTREDVERRFFVHVTPAGPDALSSLRGRDRERGFANFSFDFFHRNGAEVGSSCVVEWMLPTYRIRRITTGQFVPDAGRVWGGRIDLQAQGRTSGYRSRSNR